MKKYLLKLTALVLLIGTLVGCSEDKVFYDEATRPTLARFVNSSGLMGVTENKKVKSYPVQVSTLSNINRKITARVDEDGSSTNIIIDAEGNTADITDYIEIVPEESFIPAGSYEGNVVVRFKKEYNDLTPDSELIALLVIDAVEGASVEPNNKTFLLTVFKDCDYDPTAVGTAFTAEVVADKYGTSFPGITAPSYDAVLTQNPNNNKEFSINSLWGPNFVATLLRNPSANGQIPLPGKITIDTAENTLTVVGTGSSAAYVKDGKGTYDACNNVFKYTFTQAFFLTAPPFTVTVTLRPKQ